MPKRPKQHRLEDKSRIKFQDVLPEMWVFRDKDKDYGIDAEVELFGNDEKAQGLIFWIQLKATESKEKTTILNVDMDIETLRYYKSLDIPVLLVRYSDFEGSIYVKWVNNVDLFLAKEGAKSFRIKFDVSNKWNEKTSIEIENFLGKVRQLKLGKFSFPLPIEISITEDNINGVSKGILSTQLRKELKKYYEFVLYQNSINKALINVTLDNNELKIDASNLSGCSFHSIGLREKDNFPANIVKDILLGIAVSMIKLGQTEYCGRIIFENNLKARLQEKPELIKYIIIPLFHSSYFREAILIFEGVLNDEKKIGLVLISHFHMLLSTNAKNSEKNIAIEEFLKREVVRASAIDNQQIGIANYNLANHYNSRSKFSEAIHHFNLARKLAPDYLNQAYFNAEIASVFFQCQRYKCASAFYSKSLSIEENIRELVLYADSLMFAGDYENAKKKFDEYLEKAKKPNEEFVLKSMVLELLLKKYNIKKQNRRLQEANNFADIANIKSNDINKRLEKALEFDLLSSSAWYNLGIMHSENNEFYQATMCFTISALVNTGDIEAWKNATISSLNSKSGISILPLIILTAYFFNGEEYLEELYSHIELQGNSEYLNKLAKIIDELLPREPLKEKPTIRIFDGKGKFESIDEIIKGHNNV